MSAYRVMSHDSTERVNHTIAQLPSTFVGKRKDYRDEHMAHIASGIDTHLGQNELLQNVFSSFCGTFNIVFSNTVLSRRSILVLSRQNSLKAKFSTTLQDQYRAGMH